MGHAQRREGATCLVCGHAGGRVFLEIAGAPLICNQLWSSRRQALSAPRGDIRLAHCPICGHVWNCAFDPSLVRYAPGYENSLHWSPHFLSYEEGLARRLVERYALYGKHIVEVGCGSGHFLRLLCRLGGNQGLGFDPSYSSAGNASPAPDEQARFVADRYSERFADEPVDFLCCRQTLEHLSDPVAFLATIRGTLAERPGTPVFFEVPSSLFILHDLAIWDIIYEHPSYFGPASLGHLFRSEGFAVERVDPAYGGQYLCLEGRAGAEGKSDMEGRPHPGTSDVAGLVEAFPDRYHRAVAAWRQHLRWMERNWTRPVLWGAGSKGITFLNILQEESRIELVVDNNPRKQGAYVPGTGQQIAPPEALLTYQPDAVIVMNPGYIDEIRTAMERLGVKADVVSAMGPIPHPVARSNATSRSAPKRSRN